MRVVMENEPDEIISTIRRYYDRYDEASRLTSGPFQLEFVRTCGILERHLPAVPSHVYDVGGGTGEYARHLADRGYHVDLLDPVQHHVNRANAAIVSGLGRINAQVGDARSQPYEDASSDAVLLLGPLYHLPDRDDRLAALGECRRILRPGGRLIAAAISRYASTLDGLFLGMFADPAFRAIAARDRETGQHRNAGNAAAYFTTGFFHHPTELRAEIEEAGFRIEEMCAIEGPAGLLSNFDQAWNDPTKRSWILETAEAFESEPAALAVSSHFVAVATPV